MKGALVGLLVLSGCVTATVPCPRDRLETVQIQGPDYGTLLTMVLQGAATLGPLLGSAAAAPSDGTMSVYTLSYGQQNYTCGRAAASAPTPAPLPPALKGPEPDSDVPDSGTMFHPSPLPMAIIRG